MPTTEEKAAAKAVKDAEKAAAKLADLRAEATELKVEFTAETTAEVLAELVKQAKKPVKAKQTSFDVYNKDNNLVRTYTVEQHGESAEDNANEYAKKIGGSIK